MLDPGRVILKRTVCFKKMQCAVKMDGSDNFFSVITHCFSRHQTSPVRSTSNSYKHYIHIKFQYEH